LIELNEDTTAKEQNDNSGNNDENNPHEMKKIYLTWINLWCVLFKY